MTRAEKMMLSDAIEESFRANKEVIQLRKAVILLSIINVLFVALSVALSLM